MAREHSKIRAGNDEDPGRRELAGGGAGMEMGRSRWID
jgi:hypothetical protein